VLSSLSVVVEKSVVATVVACVCLCPELVGAGRRVEYYAASRQAGRAQASKQQASESAPGNGWLVGSRESFGWWYNRVCVRRGCVRAGVYFLTLRQHSWILFDLSIAFSPNLSIFLPSHTHLTHYSHLITPHGA
jgi:hypothetical protein